jgi:hypothetical protein
MIRCGRGLIAGFFAIDLLSKLMDGVDSYVQNKRADYIDKRG